MTRAASPQRLQTILAALRERSRSDERQDFAGVDLFDDIAASSWLRFGLGLGPRDSLAKLSVAELERRALEFWAEWPLWWAFRTSAVEVCPLKGPRIRFRMDGDSHVEHRAWAKQNFAVLTASRPMSDEMGEIFDEKLRQAALERRLKSKGYAYWPSLNAPDTAWCEPGFAVPAISELAAMRIAQEFGQRAIFYVKQGEPRLVAFRWGKLCSWVGRMRILAVTDSV